MYSNYSDNYYRTPPADPVANIFAAKPKPTTTVKVNTPPPAKPKPTSVDINIKPDAALALYKLIGRSAWDDTTFALYGELGSALRTAGVSTR